MQPAFHSKRHLFLWVFCLIGLLLMPLLLPEIIPVEARYRAASRRTGPSDWLTRVALEDKSDLDILFVGGSDILTNIDHTVLAGEFKNSGVNLKSASVGMTWANTDFAFFYLKDLFKNRKVKVVVIPFHNGQGFSHSATKFIHRFDSADPELRLRAWKIALTNYAEMSLISLRLIAAGLFAPGKQTLDGFKFWKDVGEQEEKNQGTWLARVDYSTIPTVEMARIKENGFVDASIISPIEGYSVAHYGEKLPPEVSTNSESLGLYESTYYVAIKELCERNNAVLLLMNQPILWRDLDSVTIPEASLRLGIPILTAPIRALFGDSKPEEIKKYFYNDGHFNANGAKQNAFAVARTLLPFVTNGAH